MADSASTLLKPWPPTNDHAEPIITTLARINYERGGFRDLTTESLQAEAAADASAAPTQAVDKDALTNIDRDDASNTKSRVEKLYQAKAELQGHIAAAQNEALMALDFISLLISKDMPRQADQTMSPFLKQQVKPGTLGYDMWQDMAPDKARDATDATIAKGWRMEMLHQSADSLLDAATRLQADVRKETDYWTQVLEISDSGWPVSRMPRERRTLGVRYGFSEASSDFKARGMAALRSNADGTIRLELGPGASHEAHQTIRVRIVDKDGNVASESHTEQSGTGSREMQDRIRRARDSIFEQELFHEMTRETRLLGPLGVELEGTTIKIPIVSAVPDAQAEQYIHIDLVPVSAKASNVPAQPAHAMALFVRLLLTHAYHDRLAVRSELPPPLSTNPADKQFSSILRPLLAVTRHRAAIKEMGDYTRSLARLFANCGLEIKTQLLDPWGLNGTDLSTEQSRHAFMSTAASTAAGSLKSKLVLSVGLHDATTTTTTTTDLSIQVATGAGPWDNSQFRASDIFAKTGRIGTEAAIHTVFIADGSEGQKLAFENLGGALGWLEGVLGRVLGSAVARRLGDGWTLDARRGVVVASKPRVGRERTQAVRISFSHCRGGDAESVAAKCVLETQGDMGKTEWTSLEEPGQSSLWDAIDRVVNA